MYVFLMRMKNLIEEWKREEKLNKRFPKSYDNIIINKENSLYSIVPNHNNNRIE